jgi:uncharacterized pyridoxamine 5'-phosphate oxidase family protein
MEFTSTSKDMVALRLSVEVVFSDDIKTKDNVFENNP